MSETKHSHGSPWTLHRHNSAPSDLRVENADRRVIARVFGAAGCEEDAANARVIAAAPEMFAAIDEVDVFAGVTAIDGPDDEVVPVLMTRGAIRRFRAAHASVRRRPEGRWRVSTIRERAAHSLWGDGHGAVTYRDARMAVAAALDLSDDEIEAVAQEMTGGRGTVQRALIALLKLLQKELEPAPLPPEGDGA